MCQRLPMSSRGRPPLVRDEVILDRALAAFAAVGYDAMSVRALNAELGLSKETVSKRFGPKHELFEAAVRHGFRILMDDFDREIARLAPADDIARLRATVRAFMVAVSRHPTLGDLLHHDSIDESHRLVLLGETGLADRIVDTVGLLARLHDAGIIRQTKIRELWFLAQGAVAPLHFRRLAQMFDLFDGPLVEEDLLDRMTDAIMRTMLV